MLFRMNVYESKVRKKILIILVIHFAT